MKGRNAERNAWVLVRENQGVKARIAEIQAVTEARAQFSRDDMAEFLAAIITTPINQIDGSHRLAQEFVVEETKETGTRIKKRTRIKIVGKLEAARLLCEINGWKSPTEIQVDDGPNRLADIEARAANVVSLLDRAATRPHRE